MDDSRFDALTRSLSTSGSRRHSLRGLLAGALGLGLALDEIPGLAKKNKGKKKNKKKDQKHPDCRGAQPTPCGKRCCSLEESCRKGACVNHCFDGEPNRGETDTDCGGTCRNVHTCVVGQLCVEDADCDTNVCVSRPDLRQDGNLCLLCRIDSDCDRLGDPQSFRCVGNGCFECTLDSDCPRPGQAAEQRFCIEPVAGRCPANTRCACAQCRTSADCPSDQFCDENGTCEGACPTGLCDGVCRKPCTGEDDGTCCPGFACENGVCID